MSNYEKLKKNRNDMYSMAVNLTKIERRYFKIEDKTDLLSKIEKKILVKIWEIGYKAFNTLCKENDKLTEAIIIK